MRMTSKAALGAALLLVSSVTFAQLRTHARADSENLAVKVEEVVPNFIATTHPVLAAQASILTVLGMPAEASKLLATGAALTPGATRGTIDEMVELQGDAAGKIADRLDAKPQLDDAAKKVLADSVRDLAAGYANYATMSRDLEPLRKRWRGGSMTSGALFVAKSLPFAVKKLGNSLKATAEYAKANNIALAPEVAEAVSTL